jgi:hypothetical protein
MKQLYLVILLFLILFSPPFINAQDSTKTKDDDDDEWAWEFEWDEVDDWIGWSKKKPTISLLYGFSYISREDVVESFADNALMELKLGYTVEKTTRYADYINKLTYNYAFLNYNSSSLAGNDNDTSKIVTKNWQFGLGWSTGYGYKIGPQSAIIPYYSSTLSFTEIDYQNDSLSVNDEDIMNRYYGTFRFGSSSEFGIRGQITDLIIVEAGYETAAVFEAWLFWKWAGSAVIEVAANAALDAFVKEIFKTSPEAGPIVYFVLKGALGYGLYELRKSEMNWPFPSAPPISMDNFKFGMTFTF